MSMPSINVQPSSFSIYQLKHMFGSQNFINKDKGIALVGTIAATYACLYYLPPVMNRWAASVTVLTGSSFLLFGRFPAILDYISRLLYSPTISNTANMWGGRDTPPNQLHVGCKSSGSRPAKKKEEIPTPHRQPSTQVKDNAQHRVIVQRGEGIATVSPGSHYSGTRPIKKDKK